MHLLQAGSPTASGTRILGMTARLAQDCSNLDDRRYRMVVLTTC